MSVGDLSLDSNFMHYFGVECYLFSWFYNSFISLLLEVDLSLILSALVLLCLAGVVEP